MTTGAYKRERLIERYLVRAAAERGALTYKFVSPGRAGVPDRIVVLRGRVGFLELKAPLGKLSPLQRAELARLRRHGALAGVARTEAEVDAFLDDLAG